MTNVECHQCGKTFSKRKSIHTYHLKKGRTKFFCSIRCTSIYGNNRKGNLKNLTATGHCDEFSPFRYAISKTRYKESRRLYGEGTLTVQCLQEIWLKQKGICPYTGLKMELSNSTRSCDRKRTPTRASLDRIDSSKGYIQGNVEFVCLAVNYAKNSFPKEQTLNFFDSIRNSAKVAT